MKKEALEVLKNRRAVRKYKPEQIKDEELKEILEAGTFGATGAGKQSPHIVAVQNAELINQLNSMNAAVIGDLKLTPYYGAPTVIIVFADPEGATPDEDAIIVGANMLNAAYAVGVGSCWIHRSRPMFESAEGKKLMKEWGIPKNCYGMCSLAIGYADEEPVAIPRKENYFTIIR